MHNNESVLAPAPSMQPCKPDAYASFIDHCNDEFNDKNDRARFLSFLPPHTLGQLIGWHHIFRFHLHRSHCYCTKWDWLRTNITFIRILFWDLPSSLSLNFLSLQFQRHFLWDSFLSVLTCYFDIIFQVISSSPFFFYFLKVFFMRFFCWFSYNFKKVNLWTVCRQFNIRWMIWGSLASSFQKKKRNSIGTTGQTKKNSLDASSLFCTAGNNEEIVFFFLKLCHTIWLHHTFGR